MTTEELLKEAADYLAGPQHRPRSLVRKLMLHLENMRITQEQDLLYQRKLEESQKVRYEEGKLAAFSDLVKIMDSHYWDDLSKGFIGDKEITQQRILGRMK